MRRLFVTLLLLGAPALAFAADSVTSLRPEEAVPAAPTGRVVKVLPLFLDLKGRDSRSPSLLERDIYQVYLRQHTNEISAIRFDVLWKAANATNAKLKLRAELRGAGSSNLLCQTTLEQPVTPGSFRRWTPLTLQGADYNHIGKLIAWRVTLWSDDQLLGEQRSFLW
jgi:hypothetical protein